MSALAMVSDAPSLRPRDIVLVSCVRDEMLRLEAFLDYYRRLGIDRFFMVDNGSTDHTFEHLRAQRDVVLFSTQASYAASRCGVDWLNELLDRYAKGRWALVVDADEILVYPDCETLDLQGLVAYLDSCGADAMRAPLLDMYAKTPILQTGYRPGQAFIEACPYFDADSYEYAGAGPDDSRMIVRGGPRHRLFWEGRERGHPPPFLSKIPLVRWRSGRAYAQSTHLLPGATIAPVTGMLLHFKFLQDFGDRARLEAERKEHFMDARQYAVYAEVLEADRHLAAHFEGSVRYQDSLQLVALKMMRRPSGFPRCEAATEAGRSTSPR